ncbi:MAG TPA: class I SAM-dependent methyltransferase [Gaiellaceae bacterium]|nr:class I SAM-dependent methyltransferase [Gaiellaceae bacterium]
MSAAPAADVPAVVARACGRAQRLDFAYSSEPGVGALLASLAAATPDGCRIVELGTGAGVGLAWIVHGLGARVDARVTTIDVDRELQADVADDPWPPYVDFVCADGSEAVAHLAPIDLVFADAQGGKTEGLDRTIAALAPGGVLVVDDMELTRHGDDGLALVIGAVRDALVGHPDLVVAELGYSSGVVLATRRRDRP